MNTQLLQEFFAQHSQVPLRLALNLAAMSIHMFGMYYTPLSQQGSDDSRRAFSISLFSRC